MKILTLAAALALLSAPAFAQTEASIPTGDAEAGAALFERQCVACHVAANEAGEVLAGRNAQVGPNLYGVEGRTPGIYPDFEYSDAMIAYGETGVVWSEENFVAYVLDPTDFLREALEDRRARGKMAFQVRAEEDAISLYAYLYALSRPAE